MSVTELPGSHSIQTESQKLRSELKEWERSFAATNAGRTAGREDIKQHPTIAQKYKEYNKLRTKLRSQDPFASSSSPLPATKKRRLSHVGDGHSQAEELISSQSQRPLAYPISIDPYDPPLHATPRAKRTFVGPTPQKNGLVLGLFDLLSPPSANNTPSKTGSRLNPSSVSKELDSHVTPSKSRISNRLTATPARHSRTPKSASKRAYLDSILTPSTLRFNAQLTPASRTNVARQLFRKADDTPEFLRRDSQRLFPPRPPLQTVGENGEEKELGDLLASPIAVRLPPRPLIGRGLSALVKGLRKMEEDQADEDLDMLREMEAEEEAGTTITTATKKQKTLVLDSQVVAPNPTTETELPLGADGDNGESSEEDDEGAKEGLGRDGKPLKVWKKKGQKRTTRKVNIKPNTAKWKPEPEWKAGKDAEDEEADLESQVPETQLRPQGTANDAENGDEVSCLGEESDDGGEKRKKKISIAAKDKMASRGKEAKKPKKVAATAHANFRALKIKNKNSKAKKGRFGGRRR